MKQPTICVITPTIGRSTLRRTLESGVLDKDDLWEIITDGPDVYKSAKTEILDLLTVRSDLHCTTTFKSTKDYGNKLRDMIMAITGKDYFIFLDDDDIFVPGAIDIIKCETAQHYPKPIIFKMINGNGEILWKNREVTPGNVGGSMFCCPNTPGKLGKWANGAGHRSDFEFIRGTLEKYGPGWRQNIIWSGDVIIQCRPEGAING
jgi:glycosyltransferase involved in cell wall biosynthesis